MNPWYEYHDFLFGRSDSVRDLFRLGIRRLPLVFDHTARVGAQARADRDTAVAAQAAAARELIAAESAGAEMASSLSGEFDERGSVVSALKYASESLRLAPANHPQRQFFLARASQLVLRAPALDMRVQVSRVQDDNPLKNVNFSPDFHWLVSLRHNGWAELFDIGSGRRAPLADESGLKGIEADGPPHFRPDSSLLAD